MTVALKQVVAQRVILLEKKIGMNIVIENHISVTFLNP